jgi:MFS family permease
MTDPARPADHQPASRRELWKIIGASSAGTLIEWYDFYIFASLATVVSGKFFPQGQGLIAFLQTLATIWVGFAVRPFGAVFFGHLGDLIGRKHTFLITLLIMGGATFAIGLMPTYDQLQAMGGLGFLAPVLLLLFRILQGLALGGEYGGAATYIAEHAPAGQRGFWTSWIQTTATLGLFVSLGVILACRSLLSPAEFSDWGWRIPFLLSIFLVVFSYYLRTKMKESPLFARMKAGGKGSRNPIKESFGNWYNLKYVLLALFGATAGQGVVWYTGQFYALFFLQKTLAVELTQSNIIIGAALLIACPFFIIMGSLSDRIGRKPIMMLGCLLAVLTYIPLFHGLAAQADLGSKTLAPNGEVIAPTVTEPARVADKDAKIAPGDAVTRTEITRTYTDGTVARLVRLSVLTAAAPHKEFELTRTTEVKLGRGPMVISIALIAVLVTYVTMVYGPIAAFLVEMFPTRIRYTSMSLPYHIGNGVFGGLVPFAATWLASSSFAAPGAPLTDLLGGPRFVGLAYPIAIAALTFIVGMIFIREKHTTIHGENE